MSWFLLQMAGWPGSGKTTLARAIANATDAVRIDKDELMASLIDAGVEPEDAGPIAYETGFGLARSILSTGRHSVILDSPANFVTIRQKGRAIATECGVPYCIIETVVPGYQVAELRVNQRASLHTLHPTTLEGVDLAFARPGTASLTEERLTIDTSQSTDVCLQQALEYLGR